MAVKKSLQIVAEQASLEAKQKKKSGKVFEANCSKQMGQPKKLIFNQTSLCLHKAWQRYRCQLRIVSVR